MDQQQESPSLDERNREIAARYWEEIRHGRHYGAVQRLAAEYGLSNTWIKKVALAMPPDRTPEELSETPLEHQEMGVKGTSTLYGKDGKPVLQWVKATRTDDREVARAMIEGLKRELPPKRASAAPRGEHSKDLLTVIPMGDPHMGLHSWAAETGDDFDLKMAEQDLCAAVDHLVESGPRTEQCLIVNLGDFFHSDNQDNRTWRSGHALDVDSRWSKILGVGLSALRRCIESALRRHQRVTVINAIGNHDDHSSMFLSVALSHIYQNEPRVEINSAPTILHFFEFGRVMIAVHHGHTIKMDRLPLVVASERPEMWGRTEHRYAYTGHIHHDSAKEYNGMKIESFRTLAARDAWAASMGYRSGRDMKAIVHHREYGEVFRSTVSVKMLRQQKNYETV